jgi:hypothetical protein
VPTMRTLKACQEPWTRSARWPPNAWIVLVPARTSPLCGTPCEMKYSSPVLTGIRSPLMINGIAALHNDHVFVVIVSVCRRCCSFTASPKCHLAPVFSVEYVTLDARSRLIGLRDHVCRMFHEFGEIVHSCKTLSHSRF